MLNYLTFSSSTIPSSMVAKQNSFVTFQMCQSNAKHLENAQLKLTFNLSLKRARDIITLRPWAVKGFKVWLLGVRSCYWSKVASDLACRLLIGSVHVGASSLGYSDVTLTAPLGNVFDGWFPCSKTLYFCWPVWSLTSLAVIGASPGSLTREPRRCLLLPSWARAICCFIESCSWFLI